MAQSWRVGRARFVIANDGHQLAEYEHYRRWSQSPPHAEGANYDDVYVMDWARRTGKTTLRFLIRCEDCIRFPREHGRPGMFRYASAFQKNVQEIIEDISGFVLDTCPPDMRPEYKTASKARGAGFYFPEAAGGSVLRLVGLDKDPHGLRGRASDGDDLSEAGFIRHLTHAVKAVLLPQYQGRPWARLCLESSAPEEVDSEYDTVFVEDAKLRGAYTFATIDDNPRLSEGEKQKFIREAGGMDDPVCRREYYGVRGRPAETIVLPHFDRARHVVPIEAPEYALCYTMADAGFWPDYFALVFGWLDYERNKIVVAGDWIAHNAGTHEVAKAVQDGERRWFKGIQRWSGTARLIVNQDSPPERPPDGLEGFFATADPTQEERDREDKLHRPFGRVMDAEPRLRADLSRNDGLHFAPANNVDPDAQLHVLNRLFADDRVEIGPEAKATAAHCEAAFRGDNGKLARSEVHGHFDAMRALAYLPGVAEWHLDPTPPSDVLKGERAGPTFKMELTERPQTKALNKMVKPRRWRPTR